MKKLDQVSAIALGADLSRADRSVDGVVKRLASAMTALAPKKGAPVDPKDLKELRANVRLGYFAERLFGATTTLSLEKAGSVLEKTGEEFSEEEYLTDGAFRARWSRGLKTAGFVATHGNAGNANAGKGATAKPKGDKAEGDKAEGDKPVKVAPVMPDVMTRAALLQGATEALAVYISKAKTMTDVAAADIAAMVAARKLIDARLKIKFD